MKTTLRKIKSFDPQYFGSNDFMKKLCKNLGTTNLDTEVSILQILESNGVEDAFWALRTQDYKDYCLILADIAESVLDIAEEKFPKDVRPRKGIQGIRDYKDGKISIKELKSLANAVADSDQVYVSIAAVAWGATGRAIHGEYDCASKTSDAVICGATADAGDHSQLAKEIQIIKNEEILRKYLQTK